MTNTTSIIRPIRVPWLLFAATLANCVGAPVEGEVVDQRSQPLTGASFYDPANQWAPAYASDDRPARTCTVDQIGRIQRALDIAIRQAQTSPVALRRCLRNATLNDREGRHAETLLAAIASLGSVYYRCDDLGDANAEAPAIGYSYGSVTFNRGTLDDAGNSDTRIASILLHELAHEVGADHFNGGGTGGGDPTFAYSVPEQIEACSKSEETSGSATPVANGTPRSAMRYEVEAQALGAQGGTPFNSVLCADGSNGVGQGVATGDLLVAGFRIGTRVKSLQLRCNNPSANALTTATAGPTGTYSIASCGAGEVVVGVSGYEYLGAITRVSFLCAPRTQVSAGNSAPTRTLTGVGTLMGTDFERRCPDGMALKGFYGRSSTSGIEELRIVCQELDLNGTLGSPSAGTPLGTELGANEYETRFQCSDRGALNSLTGRSDGTRLTRLGGMCQPYTAFGPYPLPRVGAPVLLPESGRPIGDTIAGTPFPATPCPASEPMMVGLRVVPLHGRGRRGHGPLREPLHLGARRRGRHGRRGPLRHDAWRAADRPLRTRSVAGRDARAHGRTPSSSRATRAPIAASRGSRPSAATSRSERRPRAVHCRACANASRPLRLARPRALRALAARAGARGHLSPRRRP